MAAVQLDSEHGVWKRLGDRPLNLNDAFLRHITLPASLLGSRGSVALQFREDPGWTACLDGNGVLKMSRQTPVSRHGRPLILEHAYRASAHVNHRFDRQHHPHLETRPLPRFAIVGDLRLFMQLPTDPMTHKIGHN